MQSHIMVDHESRVFLASKITEAVHSDVSDDVKVGHPPQDMESLEGVLIQFLDCWCCQWLHIHWLCC